MIDYDKIENKLRRALKAVGEAQAQLARLADAVVSAADALADDVEEAAE